MMAENHSSMGVLAKLHYELRILIWDYLSLRKEECPASPTTKGGRLAILRTCRQLYDEVSPLIYRRETLEFQINPRYQYGSWLTVINRGGREWHLAHLEDARTRGFYDLPYHKLEGTKVQIEAPKRGDPGQIICLKQKASDLVSLLSSIAKLPKVSLYLHDTEHAKWFTDGVAQQSVPLHMSNHTFKDFRKDFEIIIMQFSCLRNVSEASVLTTKKLSDAGQSLEDIAYPMIWKETFGTCLQGAVWNDDSIQKFLDRTQSQLDEALDGLPGDTACMMRLERFSSWFEDDYWLGDSKYEADLERICRAQSGSLYNREHLIWKRYRMMLAFNPLSTAMQQVRVQSVLFADSRGYVGHWGALPWERLYKWKLYQKQLNKESHDGWKKEEWHLFYPLGIPQFDSWTALSMEYLMCPDPTDPTGIVMAFLTRLSRWDRSGGH